MTRRPALGTVLTAAVVAAVVVAHARFVALDERLPRDLGLYYRDLPAIDAALRGGRVGELLGFAATDGGWYQVAIGLWLGLVGRSAAAFRALDVLWVGLVVAGTALLARRLGDAVPRPVAQGIARSPRPDLAGFVAAALVGATAMVVVTGRSGWIHVPEAALVLGAFLALPRAGERPAWPRVAALSAFGLLAIALRPSGLVWIGLLAPLVPARVPSPAGRLAVGVAWGLGALVQASTLLPYVAAKLDARGRYAEQVPGLLPQLVQQVGVPALVLGLVGAALALRLRDRPDVWVPAAWLVVPLALVAGFRAGLDNFTLFAPGLAVLAAIGLSSRPAGAGLAGLAFATMHAPQYFPARPALGVLGVATAPGHLNYAVPYLERADRDVLALLAATCPDEREPCDLAVDQGLFQPYAEDPGALELFLGGWERVRLYPLAHGPVPADVAVDALVQYDCGGDDPWRRRYPASADHVRAVATAADLEVAWEGPVRRSTRGATCRRLWLTPGGVLARPEALPRHGPAGPPPDGTAAAIPAHGARP